MTATDPNVTVEETATDPNRDGFRILDHSPATMSRLLNLHRGKGYAATWVHIERQVTEGKDKAGNIEYYDPPKTETKEVLVIVGSDGTLYCDAPIQGASPISKTGMQVRLQEIPPVHMRWSGIGVNGFMGGRRPKPSEVYQQVWAIVDHYMDFEGSFTDQEQLCNLVACWIMATYFLDVIPVTGYLWPNGEAGSGKSHLLYIISTMAYLGQVITAGGSFASIRDMAGYGATLLFDDAEKIMDQKSGDPDKQALLLAGNRKGTTVPLKVPTASKGWETRHINAYCPKAFSAIMLPIDTLASRTIFIPLLASANGDKANSEPLDYDHWPASINRQQLVDDLWAMSLVHMGNVALSDQAISKHADMVGRKFQPWRAIFAVAHWLDAQGLTGLYQQMRETARAYQSDDHLSNSTNAGTIILLALRRIANARRIKHPQLEKITFPTSDLHASVNAIAREMDLVGDDEDFISSKSLGWRLRRMRLKRPEARNPAAREWELPIDLLDRAEIARGIPPSGEMSETAAMSETTRNPDVSDVSDKSDISTER